MYCPDENVYKNFQWFAGKIVQTVQNFCFALNKQSCKMVIYLSRKFLATSMMSEGEKKLLRTWLLMTLNFCI
jgi:hypothetical protein